MKKTDPCFFIYILCEYLNAAYKYTVGKPEGKRPSGRLGRRRKGNIRTDFKSAVWEYGLDSRGSEQGLQAGPCELRNKLWHSIKCRKFLSQMSHD